MIKKFAKSLPYFPLGVFLFTAAYGFLSIDYSYTVSSGHSRYGWLFIIYLFLPSAVFYGVSLLGNLLRGMNMAIGNMKKGKERVIGIAYILVTLLIARSLFVKNLELFFALDALGNIRNWSFVALLISLPVLDRIYHS